MPGQDERHPVFTPEELEELCEKEPPPTEAEYLERIETLVKLKAKLHPSKEDLHAQLDRLRRAIENEEERAHGTLGRKKTR